MLTICVSRFNEKSTLLPTPVTFDSSDSLKLLLTTKEEGKGKRPHQAFLVLREPTSGLEAPFPLTVKDNGKAVVEIVRLLLNSLLSSVLLVSNIHLQKHSDLPVQLAIATSPLRASLVIASFGSSEGFKKDVFDVQVTRDPGAKPIVYEKPLRYGKREEIHHIFRADPKSPPKIISFVFVLAVVATLPALFIGVCIFFFPYLYIMSSLRLVHNYVEYETLVRIGRLPMNTIESSS